MAGAVGWASQVHTEGMPVDREQPARSKWLQDGGLGEDNLYYLCCSICSTKVAACKFQSRAQKFWRERSHTPGGIAPFWGVG